MGRNHGWLLLAMIGLFGHGPISARSMRPRFTLEYDRYLRFGKPAQVRIVALREEAGPFTLRLAGEYMHHFNVLSVVPEPAAWSTGPGELLMRFESAAPGGDQFVIINLEPIRNGSVSGRLLLDGASAEIRHFIFP